MTPFLNPKREAKRHRRRIRARKRWWALSEIPHTPQWWERKIYERILEESPTSR